MNNNLPSLTNQDSYQANQLSRQSSGSQDFTVKEKMLEFFKFVGPGFLISIACLDPGNLSGDIAVGQSTGFRLYWLLLISHVMCYYIQIMAVTIGNFFQII